MGNIDSVERPDWGPGGEHRGPPSDTFHAQHSGLPSPAEVIKEMETQSGPSAATRLLVADDSPAAPVPTEVKDDSGKIIRPDWLERPRDESGQFVTELDDS